MAREHGWTSISCAAALSADDEYLCPLGIHLPRTAGLISPLTTLMTMYKLGNYSAHVTSFSDESCTG